MEYFKNRTAEIINYSFQSLLVSYLILLLIEQIWPRFVSFYINLNYLLVVVIIAGILSVFSEHKKQHYQATWKDHVFIMILALLGIIIIKFKTAQLGYLSWIVSIIAGILIYLLSQLILNEDEKQEDAEFKLPRILKNKTLFAAIVLGTLLLITIILSIVSTLSFADSARIVFGSIYVLFIPGFILTYIFFPNKKKVFDHKKQHIIAKKEIDTLERMALSFALSIAVVPLVIFYLNLIGLKINTLNVALSVGGIIILSSLILYIKNRHSTHLW